MVFVVDRIWRQELGVERKGVGGEGGGGGTRPFGGVLVG